METRKVGNKGPLMGKLPQPMENKDKRMKMKETESQKNKTTGK